MAKFIRKKELLENEQKRQELGFGTSISNARLVNTDGSFNIKRTNVDFGAWADIFHRLTVMSWPRFFVMIFATYFFVNLIFSFVYIGIGTEHLQGLSQRNVFEEFWGAFFFSAQTLTTVGYGHIAPKGVLTSAIAAIEALIGLLGFALATGLMYGRFSKPKSRILFSKNALVSPYLDMNAFMFRIINQSRNELMSVNVEVTMSRLEVSDDGNKMRKYYNLELERKSVTFFPMSWTLVHPIAENSPLLNATAENLRKSSTEILVYVKATEESFLQPVQARYSYTYNDMVMGAKFVPMFDPAQTAHTIEIDVQQLHVFKKEALN